MSSKGRRSYGSRVAEIAKRVQKNGSVTVEDLVKDWLLEHSYVRRLCRMAALKYPYLEFDPTYDETRFKVIEEVKQSGTG